ncbi:unnamed protein product [Blepharisma stoltei]|uniref:Uncharacterized protein n=1 Tax=Blepharisma stoltei TaxID=1481888 RepID=A0AAU9JRN8_9CILI|nr:unnamed protein product [Blepharisma stoltei]
MSEKNPHRRPTNNKSILKKSAANDKPNSPPTITIVDSRPNNKLKKVSFPDRAKNLPLHTIIEVEPIIYPEIAKKTGCHCTVF